MSDPKAKILIVEDSSSMINYIRSGLENEGYNILLARNGIEAIKVMENSVPDLIISDIIMPEMGGMELRNYMQNNYRLNLIPFIFLTVKTEFNDKIKGLEAGADDYITKPFKTEELLAIIRARLNRYKLLGDLIKYDKLTGLYNRRELEERLADDLNRARRYKKILTIAMLDIDHFKNVNDTYGHMTGDIVLKHVAAKCKEEIRDVDYAGRTGGEEFVIVMPETVKEHGLLAVNRIRLAVSRMSIGESQIKVTISGGIASAPEDSLNLEDLLSFADMALYRAKDAGRNNVKKYESVWSKV